MDTRKTTDVEGLADEDLADVAGGYDKYHDESPDRYYIWDGNSRTYAKYLCPNCRRPVHEGLGARYYCDPCDASWYIESRLVPNIGAGYWKEVSKQEYQLYQRVHSGR